MNDAPRELTALVEAHRQRLEMVQGSTPGPKAEWCERDEGVLVRASKYSSLDIHEAVFDAPPARRSIEDMDEGIRSHMQRRHARR